MKIIFLFLILSCMQGNAILLNENERSISFSAAMHSDNQNYILDNGDITKERVHLYNNTFSYILNGKYEFFLKYFYNNSQENGFMLPFKGEYGFVGFEYTFRERENVPLNISVNVDYGKDKDNLFNLIKYGFGISKEIGTGNYPVYPYLNFLMCSDELNIISNNYIENNLGLLIKLPVKNLNNNIFQDIIWFDLSLSNVDNDLFLGFSIGLHHNITN